jgi:hypothetical protein
LLTVGELLAGAKIDAPPTRDMRTLKKAPKVKAKSGARQKTLDESGD